jgi:hypothetical protein
LHLIENHPSADALPEPFFPFRSFAPVSGFNKGTLFSNFQLPVRELRKKDHFPGFAARRENTRSQDSIKWQILITSRHQMSYSTNHLFTLV